MSEANGLRLLAQDEDDLKIISAAVQDSVAKLADLKFDPRARQFTAIVNRFRWEAGGRAQRIRAALRFDCVLTARSQNLRQDAPDAVVELLAVSFEPNAVEGDPGGVIRLIMAGGGEVRLEAEAIEARLLDVSAPWPARRRPDHEDS